MSPFPEVKLPRHDSDHSHPPSAKTRNMWSYNSIPSYLFRAWHSIKHRDNFTIISSGIYIVGLRKSIKKLKGQLSGRDLNAYIVIFRHAV
jgi:hypothetical protein